MRTEKELSSITFLYQSRTLHVVVNTVRKNNEHFFCKNAWFLCREFLMNNFVTKYLFLHNSCSHKIQFCHFFIIAFSLNHFTWCYFCVHKLPLIVKLSHYAQNAHVVRLEHSVTLGKLWNQFLFPHTQHQQGMHLVSTCIWT